MIRRDVTKNVVCLIDMDCFYCQVEEKLEPSLKGKPVAVVQYNAWQGGGIIAVNYAARAMGVTRHMRGDEAKKHCPEIELVRVPNVREKADLTKYREAGKEVAAVLQKNTSLLERASVDEAYLDITDRVEERLRLVNSGDYELLLTKLENTYAVGYKVLDKLLRLVTNADEERDMFEEEEENDDEMEFDAPPLDEETKKSNFRLLIGATIVNEIRAQVKEETGYECSAGIAHNKILAKLACGIHKPNKQTVLPQGEVPELFKTLAVNKVRGLGGKLGEMVCETLKIQFMADLLPFTERELQSKFDEKNGSWLYLMCRGIDVEPVTAKYTTKSIGCCKKFPGKNAILGTSNLTHWLSELAGEINDRIEKDVEENGRRPQLLTVSYMQSIRGEDISSTRSIAIDSSDVQKVATDAYEVIKRNTDQFLCLKVPENLHNPIKFLGLSVGKFEKIPSNRNRIQEMFKQQKDAKGSKFTEGSIGEGDGGEARTVQKELPVERSKEAEISKEPEKSTDPPKMSFFQKYFKKIEDERNEAMVNKEKEEAEKKAIEVEEVDIESGTKKQNEEASDEAKTKSETLNKITNPAHSVIAAPSYQSEYAEYFGQNINLEEFMKVCPKCQKKVPNYDYDSHLDFHVAMELSHQQRLEHRATLQQKTPTNGNKKVSATVTSGQILKFTKKREEMATKPVMVTAAGEDKSPEELPNETEADDKQALDDKSLFDVENDDPPAVNAELGDLISQMESVSDGDEDRDRSFVPPEDESTLPLIELKTKEEDPSFSSVAPLPPPRIKVKGAELLAQPLNMEDLMKICPQCNAKVRNYEFDSHLDFHVAMELSQQQRVEYRASLKKDPAQSPKPPSKTTTSNKAAPIASSQIFKYLQKEPEDAAQHDPNTEICTECGKAIPLDQILEHLDLHVAKKLHLELQRQETTSVVTKTSSPAVAKKRKLATGQSKSIATFFRGTT